MRTWNFQLKSRRYILQLVTVFLYTWKTYYSAIFLRDVGLRGRLFDLVKFRLALLHNANSLSCLLAVFLIRCSFPFFFFVFPIFSQSAFFLELHNRQTCISLLSWFFFFFSTIGTRTKLLFHFVVVCFFFLKKNMQKNSSLFSCNKITERRSRTRPSAFLFPGNTRVTFWQKFRDTRCRCVYRLWNFVDTRWTLDEDLFQLRWIPEKYFLKTAFLCLFFFLLWHKIYCFNTN
mgnify:CR=1 FL=1